jgi:hypothetical protein
MQWIRTGRAARVVAVFFLLWTAVDLTNPSVCAIDQPPASGLRARESTVLTTGVFTQTAQNGSAEDCFCCCQHIVSTAAWLPIPQVGFAESVRLPPIDQVRVLRARLDHPPQLFYVHAQ